MRILYLSADPGVPVLGHKGASVHLREMALAFATLGHEVTVASPRVAPAENELSGDIELTEIPPVLPKECGSAALLRKRMDEQAQAVTELARALRCEAIYERYSLASTAGARAARKLGVPLFLEVNAPLRAEATQFRVLVYEEEARAAEGGCFGAAARIFAVSRTLSQWLVREGVDPGKVEVMPNAFPRRRFPPKPPLQPDDVVVVGFAGGLKLWHGIDTLLEAVVRALEHGARVRLEVAGTGPAESRLGEADLPADRFRALGHLPHAELLDRLEGWDVGLAPFAAVENFYFSPLKIFEYMAAGLCPVASALGEIPDLLDFGQTGVLVPPDDADELALALVDLDNDREQLRELGRRARGKALGGRSWVDNAREVTARIEGREAA